jgi:hypothetical protein
MMHSEWSSNTIVAAIEELFKTNPDRRISAGHGDVDEFERLTALSAARRVAMQL